MARRSSTVVPGGTDPAFLGRRAALAVEQGEALLALDVRQQGDEMPLHAREPSCAGWHSQVVCRRQRGDSPAQRSDLADPRAVWRRRAPAEICDER